MYGTVICLSCLLTAGAPVPKNRAGGDDPGEVKAVKGTRSADRPELAGGVLRDELIDFEIRDAAGKLVFAGKVQDRVVRSDQQKTLQFYFCIRKTNPDLPGKITAVRREGFEGLTADADYRIDGLGTIGPDSVSREKKGAVVGFSFGKSPVKPGAESRFCFVLTEATKYDAEAGSLVLITDDGSKATLKVAAPKR